MRPTLDEYMMELAKVAATRTTCIKRGVGCVLADSRGHVLSIAYNGVASGVPHCNEVHEKRLCAVPELPRPGRNASAPGAFYFGRAQKLHGAEHWFPKTCSNPQVGESTVPGTVTVIADVFPHACAGHYLPSGQDSCEAVHAEQNALLQCKDPWAIDTAYVTLSPCKPCMKLLLGTSCRRIVFLKEHTDLWPREQWLKAGRSWQELGKQALIQLNL